MVRAVFSMLALAAAALLADGSIAEPTTYVHPHVHRELQRQGAVNLIVTMKETPSRLLQAHDESAHRELAASTNKTASKWDVVRRGIRIKKLVDALRKHANETQRPIDDWLGERNATGTAKPLFARSRRFWMTNQLFFRNATTELVARLATLPGIKEVRVEKKFPRPQTPPVDDGEATSSRLLADAPVAVNVTVDAATAQWGVKKIGATTVWGTGNYGQGIVVGLIDTGVLASHETLSTNFRGAANYGWFDPENKASVPYDPMGHGTLVASLAVGSNGYGVAPAATWIACKSCRTDDCPESDAIACMQWMLCPTDVNGENADCSKAPHIINNSWGAVELDPSYQVAARAWVSAGIIPVFANGNDGPSCSTTNFPAAYPEVISVGSSRSDDSLSSGSSKGPSPIGLTIKPDLIAPGHSVKGAYGTSDNAYVTTLGTSLAAPYTSGSIALLLSGSAAALTLDQIRTAITTTTVRSIVATARVCGGTNDSVIPNNQFGHGRLDVVAALAATQKIPAVAPSS